MSDEMNINLMRALEFTDADLVANRRGKLTLAQKRVVRQASYVYLPRLIALIIVGGFLLILGFAPHIILTQRAIILLGLVIVGWGLVSTIQRLLQFSDDQAAGVVEQVEGEAQTTSARVRFDRQYYVTVGSTTFHVPQSVYDAVQPGFYRGYYAPYSMTLLSAEVLEDDNQAA